MKSRKRSRKNLDARIKQLMGLALRVNRETKHSVFVEFSGHVDALMVSACVGGYKSEEYPDYSQCMAENRKRRLRQALRDSRKTQQPASGQEMTDTTLCMIALGCVIFWAMSGK